MARSSAGNIVKRLDTSVPLVIDIILPVAALAAIDVGKAVDRLDALDIFGLLVTERHSGPAAGARSYPRRSWSADERRRRGRCFRRTACRQSGRRNGRQYIE